VTPDLDVATPWFGLFLPQVRMSWDEVLERVRTAEEVGFDSVWLIDHLAPPVATDHDILEGWTLAAALAARTSRIRIGHMVTCASFRHPAVLAKEAATVDVLSGGRLELGLGWGSMESELDIYGLEQQAPAVRAARLRETLEILRLMFSSERFDYEGEHFRLRGAIGRPSPAQPHVPVHVGGAGPRLTMPLVRELADWWNCPSYAVDRLPQLRELANGTRVSVQHPVGLATDVSARAVVASTLTRRFGAWGGLVTGTPDEVAHRLADESRDLGVEGFVLQFHDFGTPATLERFMAEVAPAVRAGARRSSRPPRPPPR
jgi:alkanesulfonate monooxygenase SsuD/methylene tetrahydromethanopterin reductase-like flavin-dependent oxidoreductase (luciferase family)